MKMSKLRAFACFGLLLAFSIALSLHVEHGVYFGDWWWEAPWAFVYMVSIGLLFNVFPSLMKVSR
jgi:hypothetical protein